MIRPECNTLRYKRRLFWAGRLPQRFKLPGAIQWLLQLRPKHVSSCQFMPPATRACQHASSCHFAKTSLFSLSATPRRLFSAGLQFPPGEPIEIFRIDIAPVGGGGAKNYDDQIVLSPLPPRDEARARAVRSAGFDAAKS